MTEQEVLDLVNENNNGEWTSYFLDGSREFNLYLECRTVYNGITIYSRFNEKGKPYDGRFYFGSSENEENCDILDSIENAFSRVSENHSNNLRKELNKKDDEIGGLNDKIEELKSQIDCLESGSSYQNEAVVQFAQETILKAIKGEK